MWFFRLFINCDVILWQRTATIIIIIIIKLIALLLLFIWFTLSLLPSLPLLTTPALCEQYLFSSSVLYSIYSSHIVADSLFIEVFILTIIFALESEYITLHVHRAVRIEEEWKTKKHAKITRHQTNIWKSETDCAMRHIYVHTNMCEYGSTFMYEWITEKIYIGQMASDPTTCRDSLSLLLSSFSISVASSPFSISLYPSFCPCVSFSSFVSAYFRSAFFTIMLMPHIFKWSCMSARLAFFQPPNPFIIREIVI